MQEAYVVPKGKGQESSQNDQKHSEFVIKPQHNNVPYFHQDKNLMLLPINMSYSLFDDQSTMNNQDIAEE